MAGVDLPILAGDRLRLRALSRQDVERLAEIEQLPGVREWWGPPAPLERTHEDLRNDGAAFGIEVAGVLVGWLGFDEVNEPDYRHAGLDIFLAPDHQGRGLGPEALRTAIDWLIAERGHHRFTIDPAVANERAIRAYAAVGFRPVGVMRQVERGQDGSWRDNLLMDLLAEELAA